MNLIEIHAASFATRIGQVAAAEIAGLLSTREEETWTASEFQTWFDPSLAPPAPIHLADGSVEHYDGAFLEQCAETLDKLGEYVCKNQVEQGERLYRYATGQHVVTGIGEWAALSFEQRQPWETFTATCRQAFNDLKAAQLAILDARRAAAAQAPAGLKREDSIFEEVEDTFALRPEAVEYLRISPIYERGREAELQRLANVREDELRAQAEAENAEWDKFGGDPAKFDHDGDGRAGGSRRRRPNPAHPSGSGQPLSAGEAMVRPPQNRGGRGNKKVT